MLLTRLIYIPGFERQVNVFLYYNPSAFYLLLAFYFCFLILTLLLFVESGVLRELAGIEADGVIICNSVVFCLLLYLAIATLAAFTLLALKLLFSYNNFIVGYTQSLFLFLFLFLSYFLFLLFTKSLVTNKLISKLG